MPYIKRARREEIAPLLDPIIEAIGNVHRRWVQGDINYLITRIVKAWVNRSDPSYTVMSQGIAALECAKLEMYRRMLSPFEDSKVKEDGDVY